MHFSATTPGPLWLGKICKGCWNLPALTGSSWTHACHGAFRSWKQIDQVKTQTLVRGLSTAAVRAKICKWLKIAMSLCNLQMSHTPDGNQHPILGLYTRATKICILGRPNGKVKTLSWHYFTFAPSWEFSHRCRQRHRSHASQRPPRLHQSWGYRSCN